MKRLIAPLFVASILMLITGCSTTAKRISVAARSGAYGGTKAVLKEHPDWAPKFVKAHDDLMAVATSTSTNVDIIQVIQIVQRLPVKELHSETAQIIIESTTLLIAGVDLPPIPVDRVKDVQLIARAIAEGIALALGLPISPPP